MPWNTVDMITLGARAVEAGDYQGREQTAIQHAQDQNAAQVQQNVEQRAQQTVETQPSDTEEYDMDEGGGRGAAGSGGRNRKKKEKEKEAPMAPRSDSKFDIMI
ncbi:MAG TPA: hypothetical protein DCP06_03670 [Lachnospiraceae bacterium]|nr:hypothetical protein [Lachnospiraceae bacterium]